MRSAFSVLMMAGLLLLTAGQLVAQLAPPASVAGLLKVSRGQQRVLLLYAPAPNDARLRRQRQLLAADGPGLTARDLLVRELLGSQLSAADMRYLTQRLGVKTGGFALVLVGKDGGVKRLKTQPVAPKSLFSTIDAMPMRQQEMRRRP